MTDCPRLAHEIAALHRWSTHVTEAMVSERIESHRRWHPCPNDYEPERRARDQEN